jgi:DNA-binding IclR family transcriptional regulator
MAEQLDMTIRASRLSSVTTAIRILKALAGTDETEIGISALARRLGVSKSTVHRLATTLNAEGLLDRNPDTGRYRLGVALSTLGVLVRRRMDLSNEAKPLLSELRRITDENVHLAILQGMHVTFIYDLEAAHPVRLGSRLGALRPAFRSAEGMAMMAFLDDSAIDAILQHDGDGRLRDQLDIVRRRGYALDNGEYDAGARGIAAPVRDAEGNVVAAVGVAGPSQRLSQRAIAGFAPHVIATADAVSARLGYRIGGQARG